jgi:hypothetical protein
MNWQHYHPVSIPNPRRLLSIAVTPHYEQRQAVAAVLKETCNMSRLAHASVGCCCWAEVVGLG